MNSCNYIDRSAIKSVGPAHYSPKVDLVHKVSNGAGWSYSNARRGSDHQCIATPGPGQYNQQQLSISVKQIQNLLNSEAGRDIHDGVMLQDNIQDMLENVHKDEHRLKLDNHLN